MAKTKKKQKVRRRVAAEIGADVTEILEAASQVQAHQVDSIGRFEMLIDAVGESLQVAHKGRTTVRHMQANLIESEIKNYLADRRKILKSKSLSNAIILRSHQVRDSFERVIVKSLEIQEVRRKNFLKSMRPLTRLATGGERRV